MSEWAGLVHKLETVRLGYPDDNEWANGYKAGQKDAANSVRHLLSKEPVSAEVRPSSLRDRFAAAALASMGGFVADVRKAWDGDAIHEYGHVEADAIATAAYVVADAMLKVRDE